MKDIIGSRKLVDVIESSYPTGFSHRGGSGGNGQVLQKTNLNPTVEFQHSLV